MSEPDPHLEYLLNVTGLGHGGAWGLPLKNEVQGGAWSLQTKANIKDGATSGSSSNSSSPWSSKSVSDIVTPKKPTTTATAATPPSLNAKALTFVPGGAYSQTGYS